MGVLPLQFESGQSAESLGLNGEETFDLRGISKLLGEKFANGRALAVKAFDAAGKSKDFNVVVRIDTPQEILYYQNGGILHYVLRQLVTA